MLCIFAIRSLTDLPFISGYLFRFSVLILDLIFLLGPNGFSLDDNLIILNTSGEIYSIDINTRRINWIHNTFSQEVSNNTLLFFPQPLVSDDNYLFYSSNKEFRVFDKKIGSSLSKISINIALKPIVSNETVFLITNNNLVVCYNL